MPGNTKNRKPVIVYLPHDVYDEVEKMARKQDRSLSYICGWLIRGSLRDRAAMRQAIEDAPRDAT